MLKLERYTLEFPIRTTPKLLFTLISSPEGLSRWFADQVRVDDQVFCFQWKDSQQTAELLDYKEFEYVKFRWTDDFHEGYILELHIRQETLSGEVALEVTDYSEASDMEFNQRLWNTQVGKLQRLFST